MYIFLFFFSLQKEKEDNNTYNKKLKLLVVCDVINLVKVLYDIKDRTKKFVMSNKNRDWFLNRYVSFYYFNYYSRIYSSVQ